MQTSLTDWTLKVWPMSGGTEFATVSKSGSPAPPQPPQPAAPSHVAGFVAKSVLIIMPFSIEKPTPSVR